MDVLVERSVGGERLEQHDRVTRVATLDQRGRESNRNRDVQRRRADRGAAFAQSS